MLGFTITACSPEGAVKNDGDVTKHDGLDRSTATYDFFGAWDEAAGAE